MNARWIALALAAALVPGAAQADRPDGWITAKVKYQLLTDEAVNGTHLNVDTTDRRVTLHGTLASQELVNRAGAVASQVEGVREVRNLIQVVPETGRPRVRRNDRAIQRRVEDVLREDSVLAAETVQVKSVNEGVVLLSGRVSSTARHERAIRLARSVEGVDRVASQIEGPNDEADLVIWRAGKDEVPSEEKGTWDPLITTRVKLGLMAAEDVPAMSINVDTSAGVVTLFGEVEDETARERAAEVAAKVNGVVSVENHLQVVPARRQDAVEARDRAVRERIEARLEQDALLAGSDIDVEVSNGVARLSGGVEGDHQRLAALVAARTTDGVTKVIDDLVLAAD